MQMIGGKKLLPKTGNLGLLRVIAVKYHILKKGKINPRVGETITLLYIFLIRKILGDTQQDFLLIDMDIIKVAIAGRLGING